MGAALVKVAPSENPYRREKHRDSLGEAKKFRRYSISVVKPAASEFCVQ